MIRFRRIAVAALMLIASFVIPKPAIVEFPDEPAQAQFGYGYDPSPADCARTSGTSRLCVTNNSSFMITGIEAGSFMAPDGHWVPIPGGYVAPGRTTMVNFPVWAHGTCVLNVFVQTWQGTTHMFPQLNVCRTTRIIIGGW